MFSKATVVGNDVSPFYAASGQAIAKKCGWNFSKYWRDRNGNVVVIYSSKGPANRKFGAEIERLPAQR